MWLKIEFSWYGMVKLPCGPVSLFYAVLTYLQHEKRFGDALRLFYSLRQLLVTGFTAKTVVCGMIEV